MSALGHNGHSSLYSRRLLPDRKRTLISGLRMFALCPTGPRCRPSSWAASIGQDIAVARVARRNFCVVIFPGTFENTSFVWTSYWFYASTLVGK